MNKYFNGVGKYLTDEEKKRLEDDRKKRESEKDSHSNDGNGTGKLKPQLRG